MDTTPRTEALRTAKAIIASHGMVAYMNKHNREMLSREVMGDTTGVRYEYLLDPTKNAWAGDNPSCSISVVYNTDPTGSRLSTTGDMIVDQFLRISVSTQANDMDMNVFRRRENMNTMLGMLCDMLQTSLPQKLTLTMETAAELVDRQQKAGEQLVGAEIFQNIGEGGLKGLRKNGSPRTFRLTEAYTSISGKYPNTGTYRFRHVRLMDRRGRPKDVFYYSMRVFGGGDAAPPVVSVRRVSEP